MNADVIGIAWVFFVTVAAIVAIWTKDHRDQRKIKLARQLARHMKAFGVPRIGYTPRGDRVIVRRAERKPQEVGGIALPDSQQRPLNSGIVIAVGPGARNSVTGEIDAIGDLEPGDTVEFLDYAGAEIEVDGETYLCMREVEIHGKRA